jgi:hypothetical protein
MTPFEQQKIEMELRSFTSRNFERPANCRDLEQVRFYVRELCLKIEEMEMEFDYVPEWAYALLSQYNAKQNMMLQLEFRSEYSS